MDRVLTVASDLSSLRKRAKKVKNTSDVLIEVQRMKRAVAEIEAISGKKCEGLSAPQIGIPLRIIILRKSDEMAPINPERYADSFLTVDGIKAEFDRAMAEYKEWQRIHGGVFDPWHVLINPTFIRSEGTYESTEACSSIPGVVCSCLRPNDAVFRFYGLRSNVLYVNEFGSHVYSNRSKPQHAKDDAAAAVAHHFDHLNGVLMSDNAVATVPSSSSALAL